MMCFDLDLFNVNGSGRKFISRDTFLTLPKLIGATGTTAGGLLPPPGAQGLDGSDPEKNLARKPLPGSEVLVGVTRGRSSTAEKNGAAQGSAEPLLVVPVSTAAAHPAVSSALRPRLFLKKRLPPSVRGAGSHRDLLFFDCEEHRPPPSGCSKGEGGESCLVGEEGVIKELIVDEGTIEASAVRGVQGAGTSVSSKVPLRRPKPLNFLLANFFLVVPSLLVVRVDALFSRWVIWENGTRRASALLLVPVRFSPGFD